MLVWPVDRQAFQHMVINESWRQNSLKVIVLKCGASIVYRYYSDSDHQQSVWTWGGANIPR